MNWRDISIGKNYIGFQVWSAPMGSLQSVWMTWDEFCKLVDEANRLRQFELSRIEDQAWHNMICEPK